MDPSDETLHGELIPTPGFTFPQHRPFPMFFEPQSPPILPRQATAVIFLHGFRECAADHVELPYRFRDALPHTLWILPTANRHARVLNNGRVWYGPVALLPERPDNPQHENVDEWPSIEASSQQILSIVSLLGTHRGIPPERIVLGGFCQGGALALALGLASSLAGRFAGIFSLMGYVPLRGHLEGIREHNAPGASVADQPVFIGRARFDQVVPMWYAGACWETLEAMQVRRIEWREYPVGHRLHRRGWRRHLLKFLRDTCEFNVLL